MTSHRSKKVEAVEAVRAWGDRMALAASAACVVHCLVLPALLTALPVLAVYISVPEAFHAWAFLLAVPTSAAAVLLGCRQHRRIAPVLLVIPGLMLLGGGILVRSEALETLLSVGGASLVAAGHLRNLQILRAACRAGCV